VQYRSYPCSHGGQWESNGYEMIEALDFAGHAGQCAEEAVALLSAAQCPEGEKDIIIEGSQLSLQIHESVGHPLELDRVFGSEANFAGTSFATTDNLGKLQYGSDRVTIVSDPTCPMGLGSFGYDDEGVRARKADLIRDGLLVDYLSSRETARIIGKASTGAMRADGWGNMPIVRMTCINLEPGTKPLGQIIAETDDGLYLATNKSFSIDDRRSNFQFGTEIAWEIKNGKLGRMVKNATYTGITPQFWKTANCGKGEPGQTARTAQGCSPSRFRGVKVGVVPGKK
jgi:TldD protein